MKLSQLITKTLKNISSDEQALNAQLLIKAGYIHKEMAGVYDYLPLGLRVIEKIKQIVREEMNNIGGQELLMSTLQSKELWQKTDRWDDQKVDNWFKTKLNSGGELGIGLTHEEPIVNTMREYLKSYRDLPIKVYQIQNKFRNELRAKSGLLRGREFIMKDMYSFSLNEEEHINQYESIISAYFKIYERLGLKDVVVRTKASGGIFTDQFSDEFQAISRIGEDTIYLDEKLNVAVNKEIYNDSNLKNLNLNKNNLIEKKAVEVGNVFHLGTKYPDTLGLFYTDINGQQQSVIMGSYGFGVSRIMGFIVEHFSDEKGIIWPESIAPYKCFITFINNDKKQIELANKLYSDLTYHKIEVIYDDRNIRPAEKFADCDLLGIPVRIVINQKTVLGQGYEIKCRTESDTFTLDYSDLIDYLKRKDK